MEDWLDFARGPAFLFAFSFMILGLLRQFALTVWQITTAVHRAGEKQLPWIRISRATLNWLLPVRQLKVQLFFSLTSILFHIAVILVPIFLAGHIALWARGFGFSWPALSAWTADALTIVAVITAVALVLQRAAAKATRSLSRFSDYLLPLLIAVPFVTGYLMMHPQISPFAYDATFLLHMMSANLIFLLIPLSKLSHIVLIPETQLISEVAWHWPADAGSKVASALGKENVRI